MNQPTIPPTPGRIVHYHPAPGEFVQIGDAPLAAMVVGVLTNDCVNLTVFDANGEPHGLTSVFLHQGTAPKPDGCYAEWMPYQLGQAAKTEQLQSSLGQALRQGAPADGQSHDVATDDTSAA